MDEKITENVEIIEWLKSILNIKLIDINCIEKRINLCKINAQNSICSIDKIESNLMEFIAFEVKRDDLSKEYFENIRTKKLLMIFN